MRISADVEAAGDNHPVTPEGVVPVQEFLADMQLQLNQSGPALAGFERSLARELNRFRSIYGAALRAEAANNSQAAKIYYGELRSLTANADTTRRVVKRANAFRAAN